MTPAAGEERPVKRGTGIRIPLGAALLPAVFLLAALPLVSGCGGRPGAPSVVIVTIDTMRADRFGCYGYFRDTTPHLDAFSRESIVFERCFAPMATTLPSHLSLMTGLYPVEHGVLANVGDGGRPFSPSPKLRTFAEAAGDRGWRTAAFVSATPLKRYSGIAAGFDTFDEPDGRERPADETTDAALAWLGGHREEPYLLWVHYFDPHAPYVPPPAFHLWSGDDPEIAAWLEERAFVEAGPALDGSEVPTFEVNNDYDGEVRFVDDQFARLVEALRGRDDWDRTVMVVAGDHGEGLGQHGAWNHGEHWEEQLHVPLMIRLPDEAPRRVGDVVSLVDVLPTLLRRLGRFDDSPILAQADGAGLLAPATERLPAFAQTSARRLSTDLPLGVVTVRDDRWKYVFAFQEGESLYDLQNDPFERRNLAAANPAVAARLRAGVLGELDRQVGRARELWAGERMKQEVPLDPKTRSELEALGYAD